MSIQAIDSVHAGVLLPVEVLSSEAFAVLAAFVAINTLIYVTLAVSKMLPKVYPGDWLYALRRGNRRRESRGIHPDETAAEV
jgi:hypothetical protein